MCCYFLAMLKDFDKLFELLVFEVTVNFTVHKTPDFKLSIKTVLVLFTLDKEFDQTLALSAFELTNKSMTTPSFGRVLVTFTMAF